MGLLRLILAVCVVIAHSSPIFGWFGIQGYPAVHAFFIISGFYMALILNEKYIKKNNSYFLFITNRILRIYPIYLIFTVLVFLFSLIKFFQGNPGPENITYHFVLYFSHHSLSNSLGELINFVIRNLTLIITSDYWNVNSAVPALLLSPAWTLQIEMLFYILAPFIVRKNVKVFFLICLVYFLGIFYFFISIFHKQNFLAFDLFILPHFVYFLMGVWSYKLYRIVKKRHLPKQFLFASFIFILLYTLCYQFITPMIHFGTLSPELPYNLIVALLIPFVFLYGQSFRWDRFMGEISYPVYITHIFFVKVFYNLPGMHEQNPLSSTLVVATTLINSAFLVKYIDNYIDAYRQRRIKK